MAEVAMPVYFELSWSILSTLGIMIATLGFVVAGIIGFTAFSMIPIITSIACAIANGLCFYAFYATSYDVQSRRVAAGFADIAWLIQEAGLSFYSYQILHRLLRHASRRAFLSIFWVLMVAIVVVRAMILVMRSQFLLETAEPGTTNPARQTMINQLHIAYFILLALAESTCAYFLLGIFGVARKAIKKTLRNSTGSGINIFQILARSTEIRLAILAPIGITRSVTYTFQVSSQSATNTATQLDRFAYTLESMFPMVMIVDLLASKLINHHGGRLPTSGRSRSGGEIGLAGAGRVTVTVGGGGDRDGIHMWTKAVGSLATAVGTVGKQKEEDRIQLSSETGTSIPDSDMGADSRDDHITRTTQISQTVSRA